MTARITGRAVAGTAGRVRRRIGAPPLVARSGTDRSVPWMIAPMAYLATLALALAMALSGLVARWDVGLAGTLTAQLPAAAAADQRAAGVAAALGAIRATPGVRQAAALDEAEIARLLAPWLGEDLLPSDLPLPLLIDIRLEPGAAVDVEALRGRLAEAAPGATLDDHSGWLGELRGLAGAVQGAALGIVLLIGLAAVVTVVFVIRTQLAIHQPVIELLHQLGATDLTIAQEFERHALAFGTAGGTIGLALGVATVLGVAAFAGGGGEAAALLPGLTLAVWQWLALLLVPAATAGLAALTARLTVLRALAGLP